LVDAGQHPPQPAAAVRREQAQPRLVVAAELLERGAERLAAEHAALTVVENAEARVDPGGERVRLQQAVAEAVDGRDPGAVEPALEVVPAELVQPLADAPAQLAGRALGVRDDEDRLDVEAAVADGAAEALDDDGRLAGARPRGDEDDALLLDCAELLLVDRLYDHAVALNSLGPGQRRRRPNQQSRLGLNATSQAKSRLMTA